MPILDSIKRYLPLFATTLALSAGYVWLEMVSPAIPTGPQELVQLDGVVIKAEPLRKRRIGTETYAAISFRSGNNTYFVRSEDLSLLQELREGTHARVGVTEKKSRLGHSLIWNVSTDSGFQRDYADIYGYASPGTKINWPYLLFCLFGVLWTSYMTLWRRA